MTRMALFLGKVLAVFILVIAVISTAAGYSIGFSTQAALCLNERFFLIHLGHPKTFHRGDYVQFVVSPGANLMGPLFDGHMIVKTIGAVPGDRIKVAKSKLYINDVYIDDLPASDIPKTARYLGVSVDAFERDVVVPDKHLFMLGTIKGSFDSRYWGFVSMRDVIGTAYPIY